MMFGCLRWEEAVWCYTRKTVHNSGDLSSSVTSVASCVDPRRILLEAQFIHQSNGNDDTSLAHIKELSQKSNNAITVNERTIKIKL